jgi:hypothetical protein
MTANPRAVGAIAGFGVTLTLVALDAAPVVEGAARLPIGLGGFLLVGVVAGLLANNGRTWVWLVGGVLAATVLALLTRIVFVSVTGPSIVPVDAWRLWLFGSLVVMVVLVSVGLAIGRGLRGWRPGGSWRVLAPAIRLGVASLLVSGAIAVGFSTTRLVLGGDLPILTARITDSAVTLSPAVVGGGPYVLIVESAASRPRWLTSVASSEPTGASYADMVGLTNAETNTFFDGAWLAAGPLSPARYAQAGRFELEPGERRFGGEYTFLSLSGSSVIWYASEPGRTTAIPSCDAIDPDTGGCVEGMPSQGGEIAWPPEHWATLTIEAP